MLQTRLNNILFFLALSFVACAQEGQVTASQDVLAKAVEVSSITERQGRTPSHFDPSAAPNGKILMIASNPAVSAQTGWPIGCWAAELTHPYHVFAEAGYAITLASPEGGEIEFDGYSDPRHESGYSASDLLSLGFVSDPSLVGLMKNTVSIADVNPADFDAIFLVGGQAPMYTFKDNKALMSFFANFYETGKPTAAVCHSTTILTDVRTGDGELLVSGKTWTGFANSEEDFADQAMGQQIQPYRIEDNARAISNTTFKVAPAFTPYAIRDGNLITGQQQNSGALAAEMVVEALEE